jgi:transcriptional regulator with XRE-family HTH domain
MAKTNQLLGLRIRELRKNAGLSQERLSEIISVDPKHLSRIELGKSFSTLDTLEAIAKTLNVEIRDLFDFSHLKPQAENKKQLNMLLEDASEKQLQLIYKIAKALLK